METPEDYPGWLSSWESFIACPLRSSCPHVKPASDVHRFAFGNPCELMDDSELPSSSIKLGRVEVCMLNTHPPLDAWDFVQIKLGGVWCHSPHVCDHWSMTGRPTVMPGVTAGYPPMWPLGHVGRFLSVWLWSWLSAVSSQDITHLSWTWGPDRHL